MNEALSSALEHLRLEGALFFRTELTEPFELESTRSPWPTRWSRAPIG
jgi:hypothetical protein